MENKMQYITIKRSEFKSNSFRNYKEIKSDIEKHYNSLRKTESEIKYLTENKYFIKNKFKYYRDENKELDKRYSELELMIESTKQDFFETIKYIKPSPENIFFLKTLQQENKELKGIISTILYLIDPQEYTKNHKTLEGKYAGAFCIFNGSDENKIKAIKGDFAGLGSIWVNYNKPITIEGNHVLGFSKIYNSLEHSDILSDFALQKSIIEDSLNNSIVYGKEIGNSSIIKGKSFNKTQIVSANEPLFKTRNSEKTRNSFSSCIILDESFANSIIRGNHLFNYCEIGNETKEIKDIKQISGFENALINGHYNFSSCKIKGNVLRKAIINGNHNFFFAEIYFNKEIPLVNSLISGNNNFENAYFIFNKDILKDLNKKDQEKLFRVKGENNLNSIMVCVDNEIASEDFLKELVNIQYYVPLDEKIKRFIKKNILC